MTLIEGRARFTGPRELAIDDGTRVTADRIVLATGARPDEFGRTTAEGIWSLGDASTPCPLKHVANAEARVLAHNLAFPDDLRPYPHDWVPSAVFTAPQIATVGAREQDLRPECCSARTSRVIRPRCSSSLWYRRPQPVSGWLTWPGTSTGSIPR